jgi:hypothetical protein
VLSTVRAARHDVVSQALLADESWETVSAMRPSASRKVCAWWCCAWVDVFINVECVTKSMFVDDRLTRVMIVVFVLFVQLNGRSTRTM